MCIEKNMCDNIVQSFWVLTATAWVYTWQDGSGTVKHFLIYSPKQNPLFLHKLELFSLFEFAEEL